MNLCVRTNIAKKVKFDENFDVAQETDWGYRLSKHGKIKYTPESVVYHFHRPSWKSFFKQQYKYGKHMPLLYFKHKKMASGDHISKPLMIFEELIFLFGCLFTLFSFFSGVFIIPATTMFGFLFILYFYEILSLTKKIDHIIKFFILFLVRTIAWTFGLFIGFFYLIKLFLSNDYDIL
jgi:GT2 family glycosyltransferase